MVDILEYGKSIKFKHLSSNRMKIVVELLKNQRLLKYLTYLNDDPLSGEDVNSSSVLQNNIELNKFDEDVLSEAQIKLFITTQDIRFMKGRVVEDTIYTMDIVLPNKYWTIYGSMIERPIEIANEIAKSIDQQRIAGIGEVWISGFSTGKVNDHYSAANIKITVSNASIKRHI